MVVGACQSFRFFRQIIWFLGNNTALYEFRYQIMHYLIIKKSVRQSQFFIKHASHIKKYSYEVLTFLSFIFECFRSFESYFLYNHIAATLPFLNFCSSEWFFFWEIVQPISLFLKFRGRNFHVTPKKSFTSKSIFCWSKNFRGRKKHPPATICIFGNRQQDILNATPNIHTY